MFLNLTNRLANKPLGSKQSQLACAAFTGSCWLSFCLLGLLLLMSNAQAEQQNFRLRWHQLQQHNYTQEDVKTEIRFGREVAARILANMDISDNEKVTRYLNLVGQSLVFHSNRNELQFHFALLKSTTIGAYSAPGGYVFVTEGLFNIVENEAELAAVLAHEIAHINLRHIVNELNIKATNKEELSGIARFLGASGDTTRAVIDQAVDKAYEVLFKNGYKKSQELEADANGLELLAVTGYDPNALSSILHRVAKLGHSNNNKTHPQFDRRERQLIQHTTQMNLDASTVNTAALRFRQFSARSQTP